MGAVALEELTWPEVEEQLKEGRDTVVLALGATEQHGHHLPLGTDAMLGDHFAHAIADALDAFVAPTLRVGCSSHHLAFPGTLSLGEATFRAVVGDLVGSLARAGFARVVLIPTHGGNFVPLAAAAADLADEAIAVVALTEIEILLQLALIGQEEHGVPVEEGGLHAGEWETSMLLAVRPELARMDRAEPGFTGDPRLAMAGLFADGVDAIAANGVIGDPVRASAEHGRRYWDRAIALTLRAIAAAGRGG